MHNDNVLSSEVVIVQLRKSMHINAIQKKQIHIILMFLAPRLQDALIFCKGVLS